MLLLRKEWTFLWKNTFGRIEDGGTQGDKAKNWKSPPVVEGGGGDGLKRALWEDYHLLKPEERRKLEVAKSADRRISSTKSRPSVPIRKGGGSYTRVSGVPEGALAYFRERIISQGLRKVNFQ